MLFSVYTILYGELYQVGGRKVQEQKAILHLYHDGWVWIFYTIVGVGLPVLLKNGVGMVRRKNYARIKK